jgi:putative ABC transport system ATP-binding protein
LKDVNLQIKKGEFVVIVGPSGSGKTTLLNIISGMDRATYGRVIVAGENLINMNNARLTDFRRRNIGYVFQQYALLPNLTVKENIEIGQHLQKDKSKRISIDKLLHSLDMYEQRNKFPHELSGGQQQRVSIARSMAKNPNIIFGDEPTGAVDEATSKNILDMFIKLNKQYKTTVVIVTHNQELTKLASTIIQVKDGYAQKTFG